MKFKEFQYKINMILFYMNKIKKLLYSKYGKYLISIILGLGFATVFGTGCHSLSCKTLKAPHSKRIEKHIWMHNNNCYKYKTHTEACKKNKVKVMRY